MKTAVIQPTARFDFRQSLSMLRDAGTGDAHDAIDVEAARLTRPVILEGAPYLLTIEADDDGLDVTVRAADGEADPTTAVMNAATAWVTDRFWLDADMDAVREALAVDEYGTLLTERHWPARPANYASAWEGLLVVLAHTQISRPFARQLEGQLAERYGTAATFDGVTYHLAPTPEQLLAATTEELREMRFSRQKAAYLVGLARAVHDEPELYDFRAMRQRDGAAVLEQLRELHGVGPYTASAVATYGLPHADVFVDDRALRDALGPHYFPDGGITEAAYDEATSRFAPYRTFACTYAYMDHYGDSGENETDGPAVDTVRDDAPTARAP